MIDAGRSDFGGPGTRFLFLLGYAGWGPGQLESEIAAGSWVLVPVNEANGGAACVAVDFVFDCDPQRMWHEALAAIGVDPERLVGLQGNRSLH